MVQIPNLLACYSMVAIAIERVCEEQYAINIFYVYELVGFII
jgi:hypothetical protein